LKNYSNYCWRTQRKSQQMYTSSNPTESHTNCP
jgi:hypothetical protein